MSTPSSPSPAPDAPLFAIVPADRLYWAVLDGDRTPGPSGLRSPSRRRAQWRFAFEDALPVAVDDVACAFVQAGNKVIACGLPLEHLATLVDPGTRTLCPDMMPDWVQREAGTDRAAPPSPWQLNLLTQTHEPPAARRARRLQVLHAAGISACLLAVFVTGVERRIAALNARATAASERATAAYARLLPATASAQPPSVRLASELRTLERLAFRPAAASSGAAASHSNDDPDFDAAVALSQLLALVPDMHLACDSLDITPGRAALVAVVASTDDAQRLAAAFDSRGAGPWTLRQPQVSAEAAPDGRPAVRVSITLEPRAAVAMTTESMP